MNKPIKVKLISYVNLDIRIIEDDVDDNEVYFNIIKFKKKTHTDDYYIHMFESISVKSAYRLTLV